MAYLNLNYQLLLFTPGKYPYSETRTSSSGIKIFAINTYIERKELRNLLYIYIYFVYILLSCLCLRLPGIYGTIAE